MASPRITWNGNNLDLEDLSDYRATRGKKAITSRADNGQSYTYIHETFDVVEVGIDSFNSTATRNALVAWWAWASQGKVYSFALDAAKTVNTTLSTSPAVGATSFNVNSTSGITANRPYLVRDTDGIEEEVVIVSSVSSSTVNFNTTPLKFAYTAGATFRDPDYFPKLETVDESFPVVENPGLTYTLRHTAREYKGT